VAKIRSEDRRERLARALRENLKRRKTRDRASADLPSQQSHPDASTSHESDTADPAKAGLRQNPAAKRS